MFQSGGGRDFLVASSYNSEDLEFRVLVKQGYREDEARALVEAFHQGRNPDGRFVFHFTTCRAAKSILKEGFRPGRRGYSGRGVYACTIPTPGALFKTLVLGLWNKPARIPIDVRKHRGFKRVSWPPKTAFCKLRSSERLDL